jgi:hypothetical protein
MMTMMMMMMIRYDGGGVDVDEYDDDNRWCDTDYDRWWLW